MTTVCHTARAVSLIDQRLSIPPRRYALGGSEAQAWRTLRTMAHLRIAWATPTRPLRSGSARHLAARSAAIVRAALEASGAKLWTMAQLPLAWATPTRGLRQAPEGSRPRAEPLAIGGVLAAVAGAQPADRLNPAAGPLARPLPRPGGLRLAPQGLTRPSDHAEGSPCGSRGDPLRKGEASIDTGLVIGGAAGSVFRAADRLCQRRG